MTDAQRHEIKRRMTHFFRGPEFQAYFEKTHAIGPGLLIVAGLVTLILPWISLRFWKRLFSGHYRSEKLRQQYENLAESGEVITTYVVIANVALMHTTGASAPALVLGNFNGDRDERQLLALSEQLAEVAMGGEVPGFSPRLAKEFRDHEYRFKRRRKLPMEITGGIEAIAFEIQIDSEFLPGHSLHMDAIVCLAEPGPRGLIMMVPFSLISDLLAPPGATGFQLSS